MVNISDFQEALITTYLIATFAGGWFWELLSSVRGDYQVIFKSPLSFQSIVFALSRVTTCAYIVQSVVLDVLTYSERGFDPFEGAIPITVTEYVHLSLSAGWFYAFAVPLNSLLLFFRVHAIFHDSRGIIIAFGVLWLLTWSSLAAPIVCKGWQICGNGSLAIPPGVFMLTLYDTVVYVAITIRLTELTSPKNFKSYVRTFFAGHGMGRISKSLFASGQTYFLATVGTNLFTTVVVIIGYVLGGGAVPDIVIAASSVPNVALQNALACRIHRELKLGIMPEQNLPGLGHHELSTIDKD